MKQEMTTVAVINNKGGTGKTATAVNLTAILAKWDYKVLLVDMDAQASASMALGINRVDLSPSLAEVILEDKDIASSLRPTFLAKLHLLTGHMDLASTDVALADRKDKEFVLKSKLEAIKTRYDFIILDCPPSLSLLPVNGLASADGYIVPVTPEYLALEGLISLQEALDRLHQKLDLNLELLGILMTMIRSVRGMNREVINLIKDHFNGRVFETMIKCDQSICNAPAYSQDVVTYKRRSKGAKSYQSMARELVCKCSKEGA